MRQNQEDKGKKSLAKINPAGSIEYSQVF